MDENADYLFKYLNDTLETTKPTTVEKDGSMYCPYCMSKLTPKMTDGKYSINWCSCDTAKEEKARKTLLETQKNALSKMIEDITKSQQELDTFTMKASFDNLVKLENDIHDKLMKNIIEFYKKEFSD